ncbi:translational GTPase TypA [candidate division WWE3 bacterium]|nr:translational GTPase TypA [candidate division WWE3 bacterium]
MIDPKTIRNIAIIAHVDHGKTTLVDGLLKQSKIFRENEAEMQQTTILDSNTLERERGITILAKNTAVEWNGVKINIIDTPGHADFSGEVERVLNMADGVLLIVDAAEGVMAQTRYVLKLALEAELTPIVVVNKIDRKDQRIAQVRQEVENLFLELAKNESQLNFPLLYSIGRDGIAGHTVQPDHDGALQIIDSTDLTPLFETIIDVIHSPEGEVDKPFQMQVTSLDYDDYKGKYVIGRIRRGVIRKGEPLAVVNDTGITEQGKCDYLFTYKGLHKQETEEAGIGDIIAIAGLSKANIGDTITLKDTPEPLETLHISEPTVKIGMWVNTSPYAGKEGQFTTSRQIRARLDKELETNVSLQVSDSEQGEGFIIAGRGELHLSILIETMRREGYEFAVSSPEVILKKDDSGTLTEPFEMLFIEVPTEHVGAITTEMGLRKARLINMITEGDKVKFEYEISTRNLLGFRSRVVTQTSGRALVNSLFLGYQPAGELSQIERNGVLIAGDTGVSTTYSLNNVQERGETIIGPSVDVYTGMIVGINNKKEDLVINVTKEKKLTNTRSSTADMAVKLSPPRVLTLEQMLNFLAKDELLEVTPLNLRLRKRLLDETQRRRNKQ